MPGGLLALGTSLVPWVSVPAVVLLVVVSVSAVVLLVVTSLSMVVASILGVSSSTMGGQD